MDMLLYAVLLTATLSLLLNIFLKRFDLPIIIGYILAGAIIVQVLNLHETHRQHLSELSEFGIVFLMFTIGLEFPINQLKKLKRVVLGFGSLQVLLSMVMFALLGVLLFDLDTKTALIISGALALSSTAIVLKMLQDSGDINQPYGRQALGILLFQDLAVIPLLLMVSFFSQDDHNIWTLVAQTVLSGIAVLAVLYIFGRYVLGHYFDMVNKTRSQEIFIESIFIIVLGSAALSHWFGFSYSLGAFFAGMMIAETRYRIQVAANFVPFRDLLLGVFFITVGLQISFDFLFSHVFTIFTIMSVVMILKMTLLFFILRVFSSSYVSMKTALTLSQVGEFSFALLELSRMESLIDPSLHQTLILAVVFSMILTPFVLKYINPLTQWLKLAETEEPISEPIESMKDHVIVIGYGKLGQHIVKHLKAQGLEYVAIDFHINLVHRGERRGDNVKFGDITRPSVLEHLHVKDAAAVIIAIYDDNRIAHMIEVLDEFHDRINIVTRISDVSQKSFLLHRETQSSVNENDVVSRAMVEKALLCKWSQRI